MFDWYIWLHSCHLGVRNKTTGKKKLILWMSFVAQASTIAWRNFYTATPIALSIQSLSQTVEQFQTSEGGWNIARNFSHAGLVNGCACPCLTDIVLHILSFELHTQTIHPTDWACKFSMLLWAGQCPKKLSKSQWLSDFQRANPFTPLHSYTGFVLHGMAKSIAAPTTC